MFRLRCWVGLVGHHWTLAKMLGCSHPTLEWRLAVRTRFTLGAGNATIGLGAIGSVAIRRLLTSKTASLICTVAGQMAT